MKNTKKYKAATLSLISATLFCSNAIAAGGATDYQMDYTGGTELQNFVVIDADLIESLTPLIQHSRSNLKISNSSLWKSGYIKSGGCAPYEYFTVSESGAISRDSNLKATLYNSKYAADVLITGVTLDNATADGKSYAIGITEDLGYLEVGYEVFTDNECSTKDNTIKPLPLSGGARMFVETEMTVRYLNKSTPLTSNGLYFGLTDIDAAQSYKILNSGNELSATNMFAKSAADLQPEASVTPLRNMFNSTRKYIYSQYDASQTPPTIGTSSITNIYVKLTPETQQAGLNMVFGFANTAGSGIEYYAKQFNVFYLSDEFGEITGIADEPVIAGEHPSGSDQHPNEGYVNKSWIADTDVVLTDGTTIKAGDPLTEEQIKDVVVNQDITFTALHIPEEAPAVPDTGASTKLSESATIATVSVFGVLILALMIRLLPRFTHKKIHFE